MHQLVCNLIPSYYLSLPYQERHKYIYIFYWHITENCIKKQQGQARFDVLTVMLPGSSVMTLCRCTSCSWHLKRMQCPQGSRKIAVFLDCLIAEEEGTSILWHITNCSCKKRHIPEDLKCQWRHSNMYVKCMNEQWIKQACYSSRQDWLDQKNVYSNRETCELKLYIFHSALNIILCTDKITK